MQGPLLTDIFGDLPVNSLRAYSSEILKTFDVSRWIKERGVITNDPALVDSNGLH